MGTNNTHGGRSGTATGGAERWTLRDVGYRLGRLLLWVVFIGLGAVAYHLSAQMAGLPGLPL